MNRAFTQIAATSLSSVLLNQIGEERGTEARLVYLVHGAWGDVWMQVGRCLHHMVDHELCSTVQNPDVGDVPHLETDMT